MTNTTPQEAERQVEIIDQRLDEIGWSNLSLRKELLDAKCFYLEILFSNAVANAC